MKKRPVVALINSSENTGTQVITNSTSREWSVVKTSALKENLLGPFRYGKGVRVEYFDSTAEVRQLVTIGASTTLETIVANTKYSVKIGNSNNSYESQRQQPIVFSTLFGTCVTAAADRSTVYTALKDKINAYPGLNVVAYKLTYIPYTTGTDDAGGVYINLAVGETVTQATSNCTAVVARSQITSTTGALFINHTATGNLWVFNLSSEASWDVGTNRVLTGGTTGCTVLGIAATTVHGVGLAILDDANYFFSSKQRGGVSGVYVAENFTSATAVVQRVGVYPLGQGTAMLAQKPVFDPSNQDLVSGSLEYDIQNGELPTAGKTYCKCVITTSDGDEEALGATLEDAERESILYFDETTADHVADIKVALSAAIIL